jgi:hypothetical protein
MSENWKALITRRPLLAALGATAGVAAIGGVAYEGVQLWDGPAGPYGDLLASLGHREQAVLIGKAVLSDMPKFRAVEAAKDLRRALNSSSLPALLTADAGAGRIVEAQGWVLPETLARACAVVAATAEPESLRGAR